MGMHDVTRHAMQAVGEMFASAETGGEMSEETGAESGAENSPRDILGESLTGSASGTTGAASGTTGAASGTTGAAGPSSLDTALEKATKTSRGALRRAAGHNILDNLNAAAELDAGNAETELRMVLQNEKQERESEALKTRKHLVKNLLAMKKIQQQKAAAWKGKVAAATTVANTVAESDARLKQQIDMANKTLTFVREKGQIVGVEDEKIIEKLTAREKNASKVLIDAIAVENKTALQYLLQKQALNKTIKELQTLVPEDATGGTAMSGASGSNTGNNAFENKRILSRRDKLNGDIASEGATGETGGESGATGETGTESGATGATIPDNIASTGIYEATAGEHAATGFSTEHSPVSLQEQQQKYHYHNNYYGNK